MKNIHILPTDKPSRLYIGDNQNFVFGFTQTSIQSRNDCFTNQHIYITSDEEIKEGNWVLNISNDKIFKQDNSKPDTYTLSFWRKIILTTDKDLIKDGVQAIDNEFLEWFVKNPSCEEIEVEEEDYSQKCRECGEIVKRGYSCKKGCFMRSGNFILTDKNIIYKIIIPKEEAILQILTENSVGEEDMILSDTFPKVVNCMNEMAKWQQEQDKKMYSEEEVIELLQWLTDNSSIYSIMYGHKKYRFSTNDKDFTSKEILKQFKNK